MSINDNDVKTLGLIPILKEPVNTQIIRNFFWNYRSQSELKLVFSWILLPSLININVWYCLLAAEPVTLTCMFDL